MQVSKFKARHYEEFLRNKDIIRYQPDQIHAGKEDVELGLSDIHFPHQDDAALEAALSWGEQFKPTIISLLGDVIDFYQISRFVKNPQQKSVAQEIKETRKFLSNLRARFPKARIIYKQGNHEQRIDHHIMQQAPQLYDLVSDLLEIKLGLRELGIEYHQDFFRIGKLWHLHGHEKPGGSYQPEYICNVIFNVVLDHFICGHYHRCQTKPFKAISGKVYSGLALGYLAGEMDYARINKWSQGVALIRYKDNGEFRPEVRTIVNGEVY